MTKQNGNWFDGLVGKRVTAPFGFEGKFTRIERVPIPETDQYSVCAVAEFGDGLPTLTYWGDYWTIPQSSFEAFKSRAIELGTYTPLSEGKSFSDITWGDLVKLGEV